MAETGRFTRRHFLKGAATAAVAARVPFAIEQPAIALQARAFGAAPVYDRPGGALIGHLAPDSIHTVREHGAYYVAAFGAVPRGALQPLVVSAHGQPITTVSTPLIAEISAPSAAIHAYADSAAPVMQRIGHGAVIQVVGSLPDRFGRWWIEEKSGGWIDSGQCARFDALQSDTRIGDVIALTARSCKVQIDREHYSVRASVGQQVIVDSPFTGTRDRTDTGTAAIAYCHEITIGPYIVRGAWWHNDFGNDRAQFPYLDVPIQAARRLVVLLGAQPNALVEIV